MIKVNNKSVDYKKAASLLQYDNSINPTGYGTLGILFQQGNEIVYIGIKHDVLYISTNTNIHTFINIEKKIVEKSEEIDLKNYDNFDFYKIVVNDKTIDIDLAFFRAYVYKQLDLYADLVKRNFFPINEVGAVYHLYFPSNIRSFEFRYMGFIVTDNNVYLTINNKIVNPDKLNKEIRYGYWILPQAYSTDTLGLGSRTKMAQRLLIDTSDYIKSIAKDNFSFGSKENFEFNLDSDIWFEYFNEDPVDLDEDMWKVNGEVRGTGIREKYNMTNFGIKEARKGAYYDIKPGKAFLNIGYEAPSSVFGDNFMVNKNFNSVQYVKSIALPVTNIDIGKDLLTIILGYQYTNNEASKLKEELFNVILKNKNNSVEEIKDACYQTIFYKLVDSLYETYKIKFVSGDIDEEEFKEQTRMTNDKRAYLLDFIKKNTTISLGIEFYSINDVKNETFWAIFNHPYMDYFAFKKLEAGEFVVTNTGINTYINGEKFGFDGNKFYWRGIPKEFDVDDYIKEKNNVQTIYLGLTKGYNYPKKSFTGINKDYATVFFISDNKLKKLIPKVRSEHALILDEGFIKKSIKE